MDSGDNLWSSLLISLQLFFSTLYTEKTLKLPSTDTLHQ